MPAHLLARGAITKVTVVRLSRLVMAVWRVGAPLPALERLYRSLHAARNGDPADPAVARHLFGLRARVTGTRVAPAAIQLRSKFQSRITVYGCSFQKFIV